MLDHAGHGALRPAGVRDRRQRAQLLARRREAASARSPRSRWRVQRLEAELGEKLIDAHARQGAGADRRGPHRARLRAPVRRTCAEELDGALAELRDKSAGRLVIGANESSTLYLLPHIERYRRLLPQDQGPGAAQPVEHASPPSCSRATSSSASPATIPATTASSTKVIYTDALAFVVSPKHRLARRRKPSRSPSSAWRPSSPTTSSRPTARSCCASSAATRCRCNMDVEMPTLETIRRLVQSDEGVAFLPRMCVRQDVETGAVREVDGQGAARRAQGPPALRQGAHAEPRRPAFLESCSDARSTPGSARTVRRLDHEIVVWHGHRHPRGGRLTVAVAAVAAEGRQRADSSACGHDAARDRYNEGSSSVRAAQPRPRSG